jgi:HlyD family secretion protein
VALVGSPVKLPLRQAWQWKWRIIAVLVVIGLTALVLILNTRRANPPLAPAAPSTEPSIVAQAQAVPARESQLNFQETGIVKEIKVKVGDQVTAGEVLATLDTRDLELKLKDAQANLAIQKAMAAQATENASEADITAARTALASALAKQQEVEAGSAPADLKAAEEAVTSAQASLESAQAEYNKVIQGPTPSDIAAAEASVKSAEAQVANAQQSLDDLKAKPKPQDIITAELALEQAKDQLYSVQTSRDGTCGAVGSGSTACKSADASVAAQETAVQSAQASLVTAQQPATPDQLASAQKALENAKAQLSSSQAALAKLKAGPTNADRQAAKSALDQAQSTLRTNQAKLAQLQAGSTPSDKAAAQNAVDQARANLAKLTNGASPATLDLNQARIQQAEIQVQEAQQAIEDAKLVSPIDGVVTAINVHLGEPAMPETSGTSSSSTAPNAIIVADLSSLHFETSDLDEVSAAKVSVGQPVTVTIPALNKQSFAGTVTEIALQPSITTSGDVNYVAKIALDRIPSGLKWGQTGRVEFVPEKK